MSRTLACLGVVVVVLATVYGGPVSAAENQPQTALAATVKAEDASAKKKAKKADRAKAKPSQQKVDANTKPATQEQAETAAKPQTTPVAKPAPEEEKKPEPKKTEKPATYTVVREPLKVELSLKGIFEAVDAVPVCVRMKQWKDLTVLEAVPHGDKVHKGQVLVRFDVEKIDEQIADLRKDLQLADLSLKQAQESLKILKQSTPLDVEMAQWNKRIADEDLQQFLKVDRPLYRKMADFMLTMSERNLEYQKEELRQLEKMYKADDLTEETEEIVLKRQRNAVQQAEFYVELAKVRHDETLKLDLPRMEQSEKYSTRQQDLQSRKTQIVLPLALKQQELELAGRTVDRQRAQKRLDEFEADRAAMTVKSPADGVVYYGHYVRGQWIGATSAAEDLQPHGTVTRDKVFMTVLRQRPMQIRADVPEESLQYVHPDLEGTVEPVSYPDMKLSAKVQSVDTMPLGNQYAAIIRPSLPHKADVLVPGMNCTVKFVPYLKKRALVVPASAVFTDKIDSEKKYVYLYEDGAKPRKQPVTVGKKSGDSLEILDGLDRGDEILLEEPKSPKDGKSKD